MNGHVDENIGIVIPARIDSSRLERKLLIDIQGLPMIEHVRRRALKNSFKIPVVVASGDIEILRVVERFGGDVIETTKVHENGLSRVGEASTQLRWDRYIILQGDEILTRPVDLDRFIGQNSKPDSKQVINAVSTIESETELGDDSIVKCITSSNDSILFIFRKNPMISDVATQLKLIKKICGLFGITNDALQQVLSQQNTPVATNESIEQLKFLEMGIPLGFCVLESDFPSVNLKKDLDLVIKILANNEHQAEILKSIL